MVLINCPECSNQVSTAAASCPKCGAPIASQSIGTPLATIQQTSKQLKVHIIFSSLAFWIGLFWFIFALASEQQTSSIIAIILLIVGMVWYLATKIRIWWHHK